jgi:hypothetical protein
MSRKTGTKGKKKARPARRRVLTREQEMKVVVAFLAGETQEDLADRFRVGLNTVARCLRRHGATAAKRDSSGARRESAVGTAEQADPAALELYRAVGLPPLGNTLGSSGWLHRALIAMAAQAMTDGTLTEKQRRRDMVALARASTGAFPLAVLDEATKLIGAERSMLKRFDPDVPLVSRAELDARDRAAGREPMKSVNAVEWEGRSSEELDS